MKSTKLHKFIFTMVLSVCVVVPLTNDLFISGMPEMAMVFKGENISWVLSISLLGLAIAQLFYGPLSDRFGRKPVLLAGLLLFTLASVEVMWAHAYIPLLIGRFFQAVGACSASTSVLAIARDKYDKDDLVTATGLIMALMGIGPVLSPFLGSLLNDLRGWRASFVFLFILGCFYLIWISFALQETHLHKNRQSLAYKQIVKNYKGLITKFDFVRYCVISALSYGILFSYINLSSYFIIEKMHYSLISFGALVATNALAIIIMAIITPKVAKRLTLENSMKIGAMIMAGGGLLMYSLGYIIGENIYTFMLPVLLTTIGFSTIRTSASAGAMQLVESKVAGSAASLFNLFISVISFMAISITAIIIHTTTQFGVFIMLIAGVALLVANISYKTNLEKLKFINKAPLSRERGRGAGERV